MLKNKFFDEVAAAAAITRNKNWAVGEQEKYFI